MMWRAAAEGVLYSFQLDRRQMFNSLANHTKPRHREAQSALRAVHVATGSLLPRVCDPEIRHQTAICMAIFL